MSTLKGNMSPKIFPLERRFLVSLAGAGVQAVIAKSFACFYERNQPSLALLGIAMSDNAFFEAVTEGEEITIDVPTRTIVVGGRKNFKFRMAEMEYRLTVSKGISESYKMYGKAIWGKLTESDLRVEVDTNGKMVDKRREWRESYYRFCSGQSYPHCSIFSEHSDGRCPLSIS